MLYIVSQIVVCLLLALALGFLIGWFLKKALEKEKENLYIESLKQDLKDKDDEWYRLKADLVKCQKREKALEIEIQKTRDQSNLIKDMKDEIRRLGEQIDTKNHEIEVLKEAIKEYQQAQNQVEEDNKRLEEYQKEIEELKDKLRVFEEENEKLENKLKKSEDKLSECKESLFALKMEDKTAPKPPVSEKKEELKAEIIVTPEPKSDKEETKSSLLKDLVGVFRKYLKKS